MNVCNNPGLSCIEVDDVSWAQANIGDWQGFCVIDPQMYYSTDCANACSFVGLEELSNIPRQLLRIVDLMGRETLCKPNTPLIYLYSDGTAERVFKIDY